MTNKQKQENCLKLGVLSSFNVNDLDSTFRFYDDYFKEYNKKLPCELYVLMQSAVKELQEKYLDLFKLQEFPTALKFLADCNQTEVIMADFIQHAINKSNIKTDPVCIQGKINDSNVDIVSFASFFPDLSSDPECDAAKLTRHAVCFMAKLALELRKRGHQEFKTIELVAGALVKNPVVDKNQEGQKIIRVSIIDQDTARTNIIGNLCLIMSDINKLNKNDNDDPLTFALEIEPGPLYATNDFDSIVRLCSALDDKPCLRNVGVNLDIAHWNIALHHNQLVRADILQSLRHENKHVFRRICHAHISGYHRAAHFGDLPIYKSSPPNSSLKNKWEDSFSEWIKLLNDRMIDQEDDPHSYTDRPRCSGYVICELEAISDASSIKDTIETLRCYL